MSPTDPAEAARQTLARVQRYRARRKSGHEPVIVRGASYSVPPKVAARIEKLCQQSEGLREVAYQWLRDGVEIPGATEATYAPGPEDDGRSVTRRTVYGSP